MKACEEGNALISPPITGEECRYSNSPAFPEPQKLTNLYPMNPETSGCISRKWYISASVSVVSVSSAKTELFKITRTEK